MAECVRLMLEIRWCGGLNESDTTRFSSIDRKVSILTPSVFAALVEVSTMFMTITQSGGMFLDSTIITSRRSWMPTDEITFNPSAEKMSKKQF